MGFRDLELFNKTLLAKTAWRIIQDPDALWCRILKGLYFPNEDFLSAKQGSRASWGWSSILEGRELLKEDLCWRVWTGERIKVFVDKWILNADGYALRSRSVNDDMKKFTVKNLIRNGAWCFEGFEECFSYDDKQLIESVKIPVVDMSYKCVWLKSRDGDYSMKLGYKVAWEKEGESRRRLLIAHIPLQSSCGRNCGK